MYERHWYVKHEFSMHHTLKTESELFLNLVLGCSPAPTCAFNIKVSRRGGIKVSGRGIYKKEGGFGNLSKRF